MILTILKTKIQEITVSESNIDYPGSIALPNELLEASGIKEFEQVYVNNKTNGNRIMTYAVRCKSKGRVTVNGAASKLFQKGDVIHVLAYVMLTHQEAENFQPTLVTTDKQNNLVSSTAYIL